MTTIEYAKSIDTGQSSSGVSETGNTIIVSVESLGKSYIVGSNRVDALRDVSLEIRKGEFIAMMAPSGSGKSTLLHTIGGLDKPTTGTVTVDGTNLMSLSDRKLSEFRCRTVGFIFQSFYLQPFLTLQRNIEVPGMFAGMPRQEQQTRAQALAELVGLGDRLQHLPKELSGGQIQRAAIARALFNRPKIIIADEPTGNLDSTSGAEVIRLFESVRKEFGTTIIIATHDREVAAHADRTISLKDGVIV